MIFESTHNSSLGLVFWNERPRSFSQSQSQHRPQSQLQSQLQSQSQSPQPHSQLPHQIQLQLQPQPQSQSQSQSQFPPQSQSQLQSQLSTPITSPSHSAKGRKRNRRKENDTVLPLSQYTEVLGRVVTDPRKALSDLRDANYQKEVTLLFLHEIDEQLLQARKSSLGTAFQCLLMHPSMDKFVSDFFSRQLCDHLRSNSQFFQNAILPELERFAPSSWIALLEKDVVSLSDEKYQKDQQILWSQTKPSLTRVKALQGIIDLICRRFLDMKIEDGVVSVAVEQVLRLIVRLQSINDPQFRIQKLVVKFWFDNRRTFYGPQEVCSLVPISNNQKKQSSYSVFPLAVTNQKETFHSIQMVTRRCHPLWEKMEFLYCWTPGEQEVISLQSIFSPDLSAVWKGNKDVNYSPGAKSGESEGCFFCHASKSNLHQRDIPRLFWSTWENLSDEERQQSVQKLIELISMHPLSFQSSTTTTTPPTSSSSPPSSLFSTSPSTPPVSKTTHHIEKCAFHVPPTLLNFDPLHGGPRVTERIIKGLARKILTKWKGQQLVEQKNKFSDTLRKLTKFDIQWDKLQEKSSTIQQTRKKTRVNKETRMSIQGDEVSLILSLFSDLLDCLYPPNHSSLQERHYRKIWEILWNSWKEICFWVQVPPPESYDVHYSKMLRLLGRTLLVGGVMLFEKNWIAFYLHIYGIHLEEAIIRHQLNEVLNQGTEGSNKLQRFWLYHSTSKGGGKGLKTDLEQLLLKYYRPFIMLSFFPQYFQETPKSLFNLPFVGVQDSQTNNKETKKRKLYSNNEEPTIESSHARVQSWLSELYDVGKEVGQEKEVLDMIGALRIPEEFKHLLPLLSDPDDPGLAQAPLQH